MARFEAVIAIIILAALGLSGFAPGRDLSAQTPAAADFIALYEACTGYAGTAGSSLKSARAACALLAFADEQDLSAADAASLRAAASAARDTLDAERREELAGNLESICALVGEALAAGDVGGVFEDAGVAEEMRALLAREGIRADWQALASALNG